MNYLLAAIAGVWMADGVALLLAPRHVITRLREVLALSPAMLRLEGVAAGLGILLLLGTEWLHYQPLWIVTGAAMVTKGVFLAVGSEEWKQWVVGWSLGREDEDFRVWVCGRITLAQS